MILVLDENCTQAQIRHLLDRLKQMGLSCHQQSRQGKPVIVIVAGVDELIQPELFTALPHVQAVEELTEPFKLTSHSLTQSKKTIALGNITLGSKDLVMMAGPCSIESEQQIHQIAQRVAHAGAQVLRGGAYKPRTSPYDFQGLGKQGARFLHEAAQQNQLLCVSEIMDIQQLQDAADYLDIIQLGARNMYNYTLLKELGRINKPILLKRGLSATYKEFLLAAEYIINAGNPNVILCERGIRTFETHTRNTLDLNAVPALQALTHLPIVVDPSHGTGLRHLVAPMAQAAVAAGADGLIIETHYDPDNALSDAKQTIHTDALAAMLPTLQQIKQII